MNCYRVRSSKSNGRYVIANDEDEARQIFMDAGRARVPARVRIKPVDAQPLLTLEGDDILEGERTGMIACVLPVSPDQPTERYWIFTP